MIRAAIYGSLMIAVILLLRRLFAKKLPKALFRLLWILAAVRLIFPFWFDIEVEVPSKAQKAVLLQPAAVYYADSAEYADESDPTAVPQDNIGADIYSILRAVYILGALVIGGFMIIAYTRMRRLALRARPLEHTRVYFGRSVAVRSSDDFSSPFSCGFWRPTVFIPTNMLTLDSSRIDVIMKHEIMHICRLDQPIKWLVAAAVCLNWYNPLAWAMLSFANRDIELACDEAVIRRTNERKNYALTLIEAAETGSAAVCSFGAPSLNERIEFIMRSKKTTIGGFIAAGAVLMLMTVFFIGVDAADNGGNGKMNSPMANTPSAQLTDAGSAPYDPAETVIATESEEEIPAATTAAPLIESEDVFEVTTVELVPTEIVGTELICPLDEYGAVTGRFGFETNPVGDTVFNNGINVAAAEGSGVRAAADGEVIYAEYSPENGNSVMIDHKNGCITAYSHLKEISCNVGDRLSVGEKLGTVGQTGMATGPNLFFSIEINGGFVDPITLF